MAVLQDKGSHEDVYADEAEKRQNEAEEKRLEPQCVCVWSLSRC